MCHITNEIQDLEHDTSTKPCLPSLPWRTLAFFGNFRSEIQTWESTSFGAKLGKKRGNQQVFTK